jgi:hypothetical protein
MEWALLAITLGNKRTCMLMGIDICRFRKVTTCACSNMEITMGVDYICF